MITKAQQIGLQYYAHLSDKSEHEFARARRSLDKAVLTEDV